MARCQEVDIAGKQIASVALEIDDKAPKDRFWVISRAEVATLDQGSDNNSASWPISVE